MERIDINPARCKGCYLCVESCPKKALSAGEQVNEKGYLPVKVETATCIACGACYRVCPDYVFTINY